MTKERAIEVLKAWDLNWSDEFTANEFEQAFAMAISALSENKVDLISRQAVLDLLENTNNGWIINEVLQLPSINSQKNIVNNGTMNITL